jgi:hypothetical protein
VSASVQCRRRFPPHPTSIGESRRFVAAALAECGLGSWSDVAMLVVSELATNAVQHTGTDFEVVIDTEDRLRLAVVDHDRRPPRPALRTVDATEARLSGLAVVAELGARWGFDPTADGKQVWWEAALPAPVTVPGAPAAPGRDRNGGGAPP